MGDDYIDAGSGNDTVDAGDGDDHVVGGSGDDIINGGLEDDHLYGGADSDLFLHAGNDGWDHYDGGEDPLNDDVDEIAVIEVSPYATFGQIKISSMVGIERISNYDTTKEVDIWVDGSFDFSDVVLTNISNTLDGGSGNDTLTGGSGTDQFVFFQDAGVDLVTDFEDGIDTLVFSNTTSLQLFDYNGDAALEYNGDTYVILQGVDVSAIDGSDIAFI